MISLWLEPKAHAKSWLTIYMDTWMKYMDEISMICLPINFVTAKEIWEKIQRDSVTSLIDPILICPGSISAELASYQ